MKKIDVIRLRKKVQELVNKGMPVARIARELAVSRPFVHKWKNSTDVQMDARGWKKGTKRKYTDEQEQKIIEVRKKIDGEFFLEEKQFSVDQN